MRRPVSTRACAPHLLVHVQALLLCRLVQHCCRTYYSHLSLPLVEHPLRPSLSIRPQAPTFSVLSQSSNTLGGALLNTAGSFDLSKLTSVSFAALRLEIGTWQVLHKLPVLQLPIELQLLLLLVSCTVVQQLPTF